MAAKRSVELRRPSSVEECLADLAAYRAEACLLGGGTDLVPRVRNGLLRWPRVIIATSTIPELTGISAGDGSVFLGPATTVREVARSAYLQEKAAVLADAGRVLGSPQVRSLATIGGNVCNASPAADAATALLALGAELELRSNASSRVLPLEEFLRGPGVTARQLDEMVTGIRFSVKTEPGEVLGGAYLKLGRRQAVDLAVVAVGVVLTMVADSAGRSTTVRWARIALASVAPTPMRAHAAEDILAGQPLTPELVVEAAKTAATCARPISDVRASAEYRKIVVRVLTGRAIEFAAERAQALGAR